MRSRWRQLLAELELGAPGKGPDETLLLRSSSAEPSRVWQREYWDRFIRDERHLRTAIDYIHQNPV